MAKGGRRAKAMKARMERKAAKRASMARDKDGKRSSDYSIKKAEQANGKFRPTSPFSCNPLETV